jgi:hypothetical protein
VSRSVLVAALVASFLLASCFSRGAVHSYRTEGGRPLADPGPEAYLVWYDGEGWHLRARSDTARRFHGRVEGGRVTGLAGLPEEAVRAEGDAIAFSFVAAGPGETGFDWRGDGCPDFSIYVDGDARPQRVFAGAYGASPPRVPFTLCR